MEFSWDPKKARSNYEKHGVSFGEAATVFLDPLAHINDDPDHSVGEYREIITGYSAARRLLLVSFTERVEGIRIINARVANRHERKDYEENR